MGQLLDALDAILALQLTVAWAGEGRSRPKRLGWWDTDLVDPEGGGDFFARLTPQTAAWASLEAVREAARRVEARARGKMADPDKVRALFFLGFEVDEQLTDRLAALKGSRRPPVEALRLPVPLGAAFDKQKVTAALPIAAFQDAAPRHLEGRESTLIEVAHVHGDRPRRDFPGGEGLPCWPPDAMWNRWASSPCFTLSPGDSPLGAARSLIVRDLRTRATN